VVVGVNRVPGPRPPIEKKQLAFLTPVLTRRRSSGRSSGSAPFVSAAIPSVAWRHSTA
jgi:hypothetical protein